MVKEEIKKQIKERMYKESEQILTGLVEETMKKVDREEWCSVHKLMKDKLWPISRKITMWDDLIRDRVKEHRL